MTRDYSLAHLTVLNLGPPEMVDVAARTGYRYVGLRLNRITPTEVLYPLMTDRALMKETKAHLADTGVGVWDIECARMGPETEPESYLRFLETGAELGALHVLAQLPDPDLSRATDRFGRLCDLARPLGLGVDLEFVSWTETPGLTRAAEVLTAVDRPNAGILVDTLHFDRSNSSLAELGQLPERWFRYAHVCDAPKERPTSTEELIFTARSERQFPGDGGIDVRGILGCLPEDITYALEIPGDSLVAEVGIEEYARRALQSSQKHLDRVGAGSGRRSSAQRTEVTT
jgi:sugar phosphate isomerase/epimerase